MSRTRTPWCCLCQEEILGNHWRTNGEDDVHDRCYQTHLRLLALETGAPVRPWNQARMEGVDGGFDRLVVGVLVLAGVLTLLMLSLIS